MSKWTKEYKQQYNKAWEARNKEKREAQRKLYYKQNRDIQIAKASTWAKENKDKFNNRQNLRRLKNKLKAISYLGGICKDCKQSFPPRVFDFHHRDDTSKEINPNVAVRLTWEKFKTELDKCDLLCANCHRLRHNNKEDIFIANGISI